MVRIYEKKYIDEEIEHSKIADNFSMHWLYYKDKLIGGTRNECSNIYHLIYSCLLDKDIQVVYLK